MSNIEIEKATVFKAALQLNFDLCIQHLAETQRMKIIKNDIQPRTYGWGQPLHLYLASSDDAAMLRLQCGDYIERFERIRPPE